MKQNSPLLPFVGNPQGVDAVAGPDSLDGLTKREGNQLDSNLSEKLFMKNLEREKIKTE